MILARRPSSNSVVKPCTIDHASVIAPACCSVSVLCGDLLVALGADRAGEPGERGVGSLTQRRPRHVQTLGAEHQPVHAGMRPSVGDVGFGTGKSLLHRRRRRGTGSGHRHAESAETDSGQFTDQPREIAEMMGGCGMRHTGLARHRPQRQPGDPIAFQHALCRLEQGLMQVAVMVGGFLG